MDSTPDLTQHGQITQHFSFQVFFCPSDVRDPGVPDKRHPSDQAHPVPGAAVSGRAGRGGEGDRTQKPLERCPGRVCHWRGHRCLSGEKETLEKQDGEGEEEETDKIQKIWRRRRRVEKGRETGRKTLERRISMMEGEKCKERAVLA